MDDLSLDMETLDAQISEAKASETYAPEDPWLARRQMHVGGSDVPVALIAMGLMRAPTNTPQYITKRTKAYRQTNGQPRIVYEKAGKVAPYRAGAAAAVGSRRELELLEEWKRVAKSDPLPHEEELDTDTAVHASQLPQEWFPLVDRHAPSLAVTPDGLVRTKTGELVCLEMKCSAKGMSRFVDGLPWYWNAQACALVAAQGIKRCLVVIGLEWARGDLLVRGPVTSFMVEPTQSQLDLVRKAATMVMDRVVEVRDGRA